MDKIISLKFIILLIFSDITSTTEIDQPAGCLKSDLDQEHADVNIIDEVDSKIGNNLLKHGTTSIVTCKSNSLSTFKVCERGEWHGDDICSMKVRLLSRPKRWWWSGRRSRQSPPTNYCSGNPCMNGATCNNHAGYYTCTCPPGWNDTTCTAEVSCEAPSSITNGYITGSSNYTYGSTVVYTCSPGYSITYGDANRYCQASGVWTGSEPRCEYVNPCSSNPCMNGATCTNITDRFTCTCQIGWIGGTCAEEVSCGAPSALTNGYISGSVYTYGRTITYNCNTGYNITDGDTNRNCQIDSDWSGTKPRCAYVSSCSSNPCMNGASCTNIIDGYTCTCGPGWIGPTCTVDVQPPVAVNCSKGINVTTNEKTETVDWSPPTFIDPMGQTITTHTNYPQNRYEFGWGDFPVQYVAVKPSNAKSSECLFEVKVRPNSCPVLPPPLNGARVCNNWKTDFGMYCLVFCTGNHTLSRGISFGDWFVCGASGMWAPSGTMPACNAQIVGSSFSSQFQFTSCGNQTDISKIKKTYIDQLKSSDFRTFCDSHSTLCTEDNVSVKC